MIRLPVTLAAVGLAFTVGVPLAHAQTGPAYGTTGYGAQQPPAPMGGQMPGSMMQHQGTMPGSGMSGSGMGGSGMGGSGMGGMQGGRVVGQDQVTMQPGMSGRERVAVPAQPFSGLNLPNQNVGNGAYNGGGMVLEYMPDGSVRAVSR
ncbi:MAG TPA: hypothetical protein VNZ61_18605 [Roseomonas sp.]|nr:hypothetical protein [Roseomonas sp.]